MCEKVQERKAFLGLRKKPWEGGGGREKRAKKTHTHHPKKCFPHTYRRCFHIAFLSEKTRDGVDYPLLHCREKG